MKSEAQIIKPEGSLRLSVINGSRLLNKVIDGKWSTIETMPDAELPSGVFNLSGAIIPEKNVHPQNYGGQVLHVNDDYVWQLSGDKIARHKRSLFEKEPIVGCRCSVSYSRGAGRVDNDSRAVREKNGIGKGRSRNI